MATQLKEGQELKREVKVHGVEAPVIFTFSQEGITAQVKGTRTPVSISWVQFVQAMNTPGNVPSYLAGKPFEFLQHQAKKKGKN